MGLGAFKEAQERLECLGVGAGDMWAQEGAKVGLGCQGKEQRIDLGVMEPG